MKITWVTFGLGWLAIIGVPPFSGFWSKDKIIEAAFVGDGWRPWVFGGAALIGAGITAFYMTRLFFMTFHGERRWTDDVHPHESPKVMTIPMMVLAIGSAVPRPGARPDRRARALARAGRRARSPRRPGDRCPVAVLTA